jgi:parvulin-like peptidyl-prolyl isomerase
MAETMGASHILLMYEGSTRSTATRSKDAALSEMEQIKEELDGGADFAGLAARHSDCPSGVKGGALGAFGRGQMVKEFEDAAFGLEVGGVSGVIETPFGYHLIYRTA